MGPNLIFDKSFLQSLNREALFELTLWFRHYALRRKYPKARLPLGRVHFAMKGLGERSAPLNGKRFRPRQVLLAMRV